MRLGQDEATNTGIGSECSVSHLSADAGKCTFPILLISNGGHMES